MAKDKEMVKHNEDETITVVLNRPVKAGDKTIAEITMRRVKVRDVVSAAPGCKSDEEKEVRVIGRISGHNPEDLQDVDYGDWQRVQAVFTDFLK